ncbi:hypothetical protein [Dictyobacter arantiisoli]|uniref:Uncharacterized protein n=1 Tax=Dictyobacter arantiisoli TaxID=2014874 RepID=A0A5A5TJM7_9CHLR|nr:hypothetical protein [Dictyobacter arantiisoli]GCF11276.1 hypothetical protein KDI_48400 [Dictyobacter arantiisoli]
MKHEDFNNIITLEVESTDERTTVLNWLYYNLGPQEPQSIIVVLPQDAVFRRPGDLRELQQVITDQNAQLVLVIEGNERLRLWARRHGFTVFSTVETCHKALFQTGGIQSPRTQRTEWQAQPEFMTVQEQSPVASFTGSWSTYSYPVESALGETYRSKWTEIAVANSRRTSGQLRQPESFEMMDVQASIDTQNTLSLMTPRITEPLGDVPTHGFVRHEARATVAVLDKPAAPFSSNLEFSLSELDTFVPRHDESAPVMDEASTSTLTKHFHHIRQDKLLLILVVLVLLGILGGVGFGYLLEIARTAPINSAPVSLLHTTFWGI